MKNRKTFPLAVSGMFIALSVVLLLLTAIIPFISYTLTAIAGMLLIVLVIQFGYKQALISFFAVFILAAILVPDKELVALYLLFFGLYPIAKERFEQLACVWKSYVLKFIFFNSCLGVLYLVLFRLLQMPELLQSFDSFRYARWLIFLLLNVGFFMYDLLLTRIISVYLQRFLSKS